MHLFISLDVLVASTEVTVSYSFDFVCGVSKVTFYFELVIHCSAFILNVSKVLKFQNHK
jgi:hypothetical protein